MKVRYGQRIVADLADLSPIVGVLNLMQLASRGRSEGAALEVLALMGIAEPSSSINHSPAATTNRAGVSFGSLALIVHGAHPTLCR
jgi:hypothetical protein